MTKIRLFHIERVCKRQFQICKLAKSYLNVWKTLWEKEKLLDVKNFFFSHSFQKTCAADTLKPGLVWERVKDSFHNLIPPIKFLHF